MGQLGFIHRDIECPEPDYGKVAHSPVNAVVADDTHCISALDAETGQSAAQVIDTAADLPVGDPLIFA